MTVLAEAATDPGERARWRVAVRLADASLGRLGYDPRRGWCVRSGSGWMPNRAAAVTAVSAAIATSSDAGDTEAVAACAKYTDRQQVLAFAATLPELQVPTDARGHR